MKRVTSQIQGFLDTGLAAIAQGRKNFFFVSRQSDEQSQVLFLGEGKKAFVLKLRVVLGEFGQHTVYDETDLQHRIIIFRGSEKREPFFIVTDLEWNYCCSSMDPQANCRIILLMTPLDPSARHTKIRDEDRVPYAVNARFDSDGPAHSVAAMALVHDQALAALWDYEMEEIRPTPAPATAEPGNEYDECEEMDDGNESFPTGRVLHW